MGLFVTNVNNFKTNLTNVLTYHQFHGIMYTVEQSNRNSIEIKKTKGEIFLLNKIKKIVTATLILASLSISATATELSSWAENDYIKANSSQLIPYSVGSQSMKSNITREQFCELIVSTYEKLNNTKITKAEENPFTDCDNQTVANAYAAKLVGGTSSTTFSPDLTVTREEMAQMIYNMLSASDLDIKFALSADSALNAYADQDSISAWARPAMATMLNYSLITGSEGNLLPKSITTCEQAIVAVSRAYSAFNDNKVEMGQIASIQSPTPEVDVTDNVFTVTWSPVEGAISYNVILRDENGAVFSETSTLFNSCEISGEYMPTAEYSITIATTLGYDQMSFSLPVTFKYVNAAEEAARAEEARLAAEAQAAAQAKATYNNEVVAEIFTEAEKYIGLPYIYGGSTPAGFDCSGYVKYVYGKSGINLYRVAADQYAKNGVYVSKENLQPGDLVFFGTNGYVGHVGIYAGDGQMLHSPRTGKSICYTSIETDYYVSRYMGAKRVIY